MPNVEILLTRGLTATVSEEDAHFGNVKWYAHKTRRDWYARRDVRVSGKRKRIYLHREILGAGPEMSVDHKDHNTLNCTRENLRLVTEQQNSANRLPKFRFKGVVRSGKSTFLARIGYRRQFINLGIFSTEELAARAYDVKALELYGEYARTNFAVGD